MNQGLKRELTVLAGLSSLGLFMLGKKKSALFMAAAGAGLNFYPTLPVSFRGKSVVILGGSRGLGYALAQKFLNEGARVSLIARDQLELDQAWAKLTQKAGNRLAVYQGDAKDKASLQKAYEEIQTQFGRIDYLINNAGSISAGPVQAMDASDFEAQMNLHFYGILNSIEASLPIFRAQGGGHLINISSIGGKIPVPHLAPYCASKFALAGLSQTLSAELMKEKIKVTTVYPGLMKTGSTVQAVLKGDPEMEFAWFTTANSIPGLSMDADVAAKKIVEAIREGRMEVRLSFSTKAAGWFHQMFPETFLSLMGATNAFLPSGTASERKTGEASKSWFFRSLLSLPFRKVQENAQARFNETGKTDAEFNMNREAKVSNPALQQASH